MRHNDNHSSGTINKNFSAGSVASSTGGASFGGVGGGAGGGGAGPGPGAAPRSREEVMARLSDLTSARGGEVRDRARVIEELGEIARFLSVENAHLTQQVDHLRSAVDSTAESAHTAVAARAGLEARCAELERREPGTASEESALAREVARIEDEIRAHLPRQVALEADSGAGGAAAAQGAAAAAGTGGLAGILGAPTRRIVAETTEGRCAALRALRERRHQELAVVLKRRIAKLEENASLAGVVDAHGSLPELLEQNRKLKDENEALRLREMRFAPHALLRRRKLADCEPAFLRLLVTALQNELSAARRLIDKYGFERNPTLGLLVAEPERAADPGTLADVDSLFRSVSELVTGEGDAGADAPWDEESPLVSSFAPEDPLDPRNGNPALDGGGDGAEDDTAEALRQRNAVLEAANAALVNELTLRDEVSARQREVDADRDDVISDLMGHRTSAKERRILELQRKNEVIVESENALLDTLAKKDKVILFQEGRAQETARERQQLVGEVTALSNRLVHLTHKCKVERDGAVLARRQLHAMRRAASTMCLALAERLDVPIRAREATVNYMFRDVFVAYVRSVEAATTLQAAFRGAIVRKRLGVDRDSIRYLADAAAAAAAAAQSRSSSSRSGSSRGGGGGNRTTAPDDSERAITVTLRGLPQIDGTLLNERNRYTFTYHRGTDAGPRSLGMAYNRPTIAIPGDPEDRALFPEQHEWLVQEAAIAGVDFEDLGCAVAARSDDGISAAVTDAIWDRLERAAPLAPVPAPPRPSEAPQVTLPATRALNEIVRASETEIDRLMVPSTALAIARREMAEVLRPQVEDEIREMRNDLDAKVAEIRRVTEALLLKPVVSRKTQTAVKLASTTSQTEDDEASAAAGKAGGKKKR